MVAQVTSHTYDLLSFERQYTDVEVYFKGFIEAIIDVARVIIGGAKKVIKYAGGYVQTFIEIVALQL